MSHPPLRFVLRLRLQKGGGVFGGHYGISLELQDKHGNKFSGPQYKLWARLIENGQWDNMERPPNTPIFGTTQPKKVAEGIYNGSFISLKVCLDMGKC